MTVRISARWFVAAMILLVVAVGFLGWLRRQRSQSSEAFASANGRVEATVYDIKTTRPGRIARVLVREGDTVEPGQIVFEIDIPDQRDQGSQAESELREAREELNQTEFIVAQKKNDVDQVTAALGRREKEFMLAQRRLERSRELFAQELIARQELSELETKLRIVEAAQALEQSRKQAAEAALTAAEFQVKQKSAAIDTVQAMMRRMRPQTEDRFLRSPIHGRVLRRAAEPGQVFAAGVRVLTVLEVPDGYYVTIVLPGAQAGRLTVGSEARVVLDASPHRVFPGVVAFVAPRPQLAATGGEDRTEGEKFMFPVKIKIAGALIEPHLQNFKTSLTGVAYVRLDVDAPWPESLQVTSPGGTPQ